MNDNEIEEFETEEVLDENTTPHHDTNLPYIEDLIFNKIKSVWMYTYNDYPDLDLYTNKTVCFVITSQYDFEHIAVKTDLYNANINILIYSRENKSKEIMKYIIDTLYDDITLGGAVDYITMDSYQFYPSIDLDKSIQCAQLIITGVGIV